MVVEMHPLPPVLMPSVCSGLRLKILLLIFELELEAIGTFLT